MSKAVTTSRHRADIPVKTPLTHLSDAVSANAGTIGRRGVVIAATGGLVVSMGLPASATEAGNDAPVKDSKQATQQHLNKQQKEVPDNDALQVPTSDSAQAGGFISFDAESAPEPEPEPQQAGTATQTTDSTATAESTTAESSTSSTTSATSNSSSASSSSSSAPSTSSGSTSSSGIISIAKRYVGSPYVYGGTSPSGWDCSGFVKYVFGQAGINLPHSSSGIKAASRVIPASEARPGDLVWHPGHVGIYAGNGTMYDAGSPSSGTSHRSYSWMGNVTFLRVG